MDWIKFISDWLGIVCLAASAVLAYLLGCFNGAVIVSKYILRDDIRTHGSGNAGLTNFYRTFGGKLTALVLALDIVKMVAAVWLSVAIGRFLGMTYLGASGVAQVAVLLKYWAGLFCLLGHMFPVTFGFKGGKGVLSGATLLFLLDWRMGLLAFGLFLLCVVLTRYVSLGSVCAAAAFPFGTWFFVSHSPVIVVFSVGLAGLVIWKHRGNIQRILKGTESKFSFHHKKDAG